MNKFLIVDDSSSARYLLKSYLGRFGECHEAEHGRDGVKMFGKALLDGAPYNLVVMDIMMPKMDGHMAVAKLREMEAKAGAPEPVKVVMLSSLDDPRNMLRAQFESGSDLYLTKPVEFQTLKEMLVSFGLVDEPALLVKPFGDEV
ncbi:CheY-like receiver domain and winged-helix DNA-binding domain containing response regulator [Desulfocurvibacter africanus PCS]|uniref:CheY-like receiver domain and winged-helix DNA-binding domain containing response regulator n=1 Tax=Desulfocurvibacter africanus PCS TaxID=1262666 RepID=M5Q150_DESAF|nr:response regulator [Desulfocurvibacter africanus]EMG37266.1 CheY-like receiver domain and winged-helix DNA-binding domain containing response regulator [Desulfocurvibacter africanus PCS]